MVIGKTAARVITSHLPTVSSGRVLGGLAVSRISFQARKRSRTDTGATAAVGVSAAVLMRLLGGGRNVRRECIRLLMDAQDA